MDYILEAKDVTKKYKTFTLNSINIKISKGKIVGLIGENGSGKTTLMSTILNQIKFEEGTIKLFGMDNQEEPLNCKKKIGFMVDECCFHNCLNAKNINKIMKGIYSEWDERCFFEFLSDFNIELNKTISAYSKGMKNKLMLAIALSHDSEFLILDEITSGLDPIVRDKILYTLKNYVTEKNASVLFSTHITSDLDKIADEVAFLHEGNLVLYNTIFDLKLKYKLLKCKKEELSTFPKKNIQKILLRKNDCLILMSGDIEEQISKFLINFNLDDLMLLLIEGEDFR